MEASKKRSSSDVIDVDNFDQDEPPMKVHKTSIPLLGIKNSSVDDEILLIKSPTERELTILGHLQGAGPDDCLPYKVSESTELVEDKDSQQFGAYDVWEMLDAHDYDEEKEKIEKMFGDAGKVSKEDEDEDEVREMEKKKVVAWALGGFENVKDLLYRRMERTSIFDLPKQPLYTILVYME